MAGCEIIFHSLEHARATLAAAEEAGMAVVLYSAEGAAGSSGIGWFKAVIDTVKCDHPDARFEAVLDCGGNAALALAALRDGCHAIAIRGAPALRRKVAAIAAAMAARVDPGARDALDLLHCANPRDAVAAWLAAANSPGSRTD